LNNKTNGFQLSACRIAKIPAFVVQSTCAEEIRVGAFEREAGIDFTSEKKAAGRGSSRPEAAMNGLAPVLDRLLDPVAGILSPEVARKLAKLRSARATQAKIDKLARRCNQGELMEAERREYEAWVQAIDFIAILQAKARVSLKRAAKMK
jgi:hypothetical protein